MEGEVGAARDHQAVIGRRDCRPPRRSTMPAVGATKLLIDSNLAALIRFARRRDSSSPECLGAREAARAAGEADISHVSPTIEGMLIDVGLGGRGQVTVSVMVTFKVDPS